MAYHTILQAFAALLFIAGAIRVQADAPNPADFVLQVANGLERLGINIVCVSDLADNAEALAKAYKALDNTVAKVKEEATAPLSEDKSAKLLRILITDSSANIRAVDSKCAEVTKYCPASKPSELGELGKALQIVGVTLRCLTADPKPEVLAQIPVIIGTAIQNIAASNGALTTSAGILLAEVKSVATKCQQLSSDCAKIVSKC